MSLTPPRVCPSRELDLKQSSDSQQASREVAVTPVLLLLPPEILFQLTGVVRCMSGGSTM